MPGWQARFKKYESEGFTIVGLALDAQGIAPAQLYYEKAGVTFPALVDPNYATGFGVVPLTFFVDELGVVQKKTGWEETVASSPSMQVVSNDVRNQWSKSGERLTPAAIDRLVQRQLQNPNDLRVAVELASCYVDLKLSRQSRELLQPMVDRLDARQMVRSKDADAKLLGQAYLQLARAYGSPAEANSQSRTAQERNATLAFYLNPTLGFGKQIARIIAPEKFDHRPNGDFDNEFREGTLKRLQRERKIWLAEGDSQ